MATADARQPLRTPRLWPELDRPVESHRERNLAGRGRRHRPRSQDRRPRLSRGSAGGLPRRAIQRRALDQRRRDQAVPHAAAEATGTDEAQPRAGRKGHDARDKTSKESVNRQARACVVLPRPTQLNHSPTLSHPTFQDPMRCREFSESCDRVGQVPSVGTRAVRRYVSIGCELVPPHDVEQPSCVHCCSRPI